MKFTKSIAQFAATVFCFFTLASASFAATKPLNYPRGLAVDSKGNLYVANYLGNQVLIYNSNYSQVTAKTITQNVNAPTGVAFDPTGNLWVANYGSSSVATYDPSGTQIGAITSNIQAPGAITVDGLGDVWVQNNQVNISVYDQFGTQLQRIAPPGVNVYGLSAGAGLLAIGGYGELVVDRAAELLVNNTKIGLTVFGAVDGLAVASDVKGNVYTGNSDGSVNYFSNQNGFMAFLQLSFPPAGLAVDNARKRVYVADELGNRILVYSAAGTLLHTIL